MISFFNKTKNLYTVVLSLRLSLCLSISLTLNSVFAFEKDTTYTVFQTFQKLKKNYPDIKYIAPDDNKKIQSFENIVYKTIADRHLHMDIYRPAKSGKFPALLMIHGGGWRSGNKSMEKPMAKQIAAAGYVTIPVEYRLSLEAKYPAAIHDIKAAIRFIKDNAEQYGIDTTRIAIEGESAGGHLAMLVAMSEGFEILEGDKTGSKSTSKVHAAIDVDGIVSFLMPGSLNIERKPDSPDAFWLGGTFANNPQVWKEASPLFYVGKNSVPVLFICSDQPRFHAGRDEMIDMLQQNRIYTEKHTFDNSPHSFWLFEPWFEPTKKHILKFMKKVF
jgi:acetyl esterase/lipase